MGQKIRPRKVKKLSWKPIKNLTVMNSKQLSMNMDFAIHTTMQTKDLLRIFKGTYPGASLEF